MDFDLKNAGKETRGQATSRRQKAHLLTMHARHGTAVGASCRTCMELIHVQHGGTTALKCRSFGVTRSEATDWRAKWPACGLHDRMKGSV